MADAADITRRGRRRRSRPAVALAGAQLGNGAVALILVQVAVQRRGRMPLCVQLFGQPVGAALGGGEDQDLSVAVAQYASAGDACARRRSRGAGVARSVVAFLRTDT